MQWHEQILKDLDKAYPELADYNIDAEHAIKQMFLYLRDFIAERKQIRLLKFGRFQIKPGLMWRTAFDLEKKIKKRKETNQDTSKLEERLLEVVEIYNEIVNDWPKLTRRKSPVTYFLLEYTNNELKKQNSIPWTYTTNSKAGRLARRQNLKQ